MRTLLLFALPLLALPLSAQQRVLHFTRTSGFDHGTGSVSHAMFTSIGAELGVIVDDDATGDPFSDPMALAAYSAIIFSNTSGNAILDPAQRANFEQWVANGGHVLGIHAASDTYRHSTSNGNNTGTWNYYAELIGASVQENPNHVAGTPAYALHHIGMHASTTNLPDPWVKNEEYYYWEGGYYGPDNTEVLRVEVTVGPNGQVNSYDAARPMSWYRELPNGSKVFYTALGHAPSNYTDDELFRTHLRDALDWLLDGTVGLDDALHTTHPGAFPNPATSAVTIHSDNANSDAFLQLIDASGRVVLTQRMEGRVQRVDVSHLASGSYVLGVGDAVRTRLCVIR